MGIRKAYGDSGSSLLSSIPVDISLIIALYYGVRKEKETSIEPSISNCHVMIVPKHFSHRTNGWAVDDIRVDWLYAIIL